MAQGFNFRSSAGYVTDPADHTYVLGDADGYPTERGGATFGISGTLPQERDRSTTYPRFAGFNSNTIDYNMVFEYDLPAAETYPLSIGMADAEFGVDAGGTLRIRDGIGGALLHEIASVAGSSATQVVDINNNLVDAASWDANAATKNLTFSGSKLVIEVGAAADTVPTRLSHVFVGDVIANTPTITDVNTDDTFTPGATNTLNGTNLSTSGGSIVIDGVTQTITNRTATAIEFTGVRGGNPYNTDLTLTYTDASSNTATLTVQQTPESGTFAVTAASPNTTDDASLWTGLVDTATSNPITIVNGDQAWVKNPNNLTNLAVAADGTITADEEGDFVVQIWLASEGVWGSDQTVTFEVPSAPGLAIARNKRVQLSIGVGL